MIGLISSLLSWGLSQMLLDFWQFSCRIMKVSFYSDFPVFTYILLFSILTPFISLGIVISELYSSNPTRYKLNNKILYQRSIKSTVIVGVSAGVMLGLVNIILLMSGLPSNLIRIASWTVIGIVVGVAESISWSFYSIEVTQSRIKQRIIQNVFLGGIGGLTAALIFEIIRRYFGLYKEPFGFLLLGICLAVFLCFATRPNYQVALRAGQGFESTRKSRGKSTINSGLLLSKAMLVSTELEFIPERTSRNIEEGLSIKFPAKTSKLLVVGSKDNADIFIPNIPYECANLKVLGNEVELECLVDNGVQVQKKKLHEGRRISLKHNQILTFYHEDDDTKFYRFVFYNRFLDPQA
jgi:hypothetical protein